MNSFYTLIKKEIEQHKDNIVFTKQGWEPLFSVSKKSKIVIIGQAPGIHAQTSAVPWDDKSGENLRNWLGLTSEQFYGDEIVSLLPMDFYYPGKGKTGDLPPRKGFAELWHPQILEYIEGDPLILLIGMYAQAHYLPNKKRTLTETVHSYQEYLPSSKLPLPHPSPRNNIWMAKNSWFQEDVLPILKKRGTEKVNKINDGYAIVYFMPPRNVY